MQEQLAKMRAQLTVVEKKRWFSTVFNAFSRKAPGAVSRRAHPTHSTVGASAPVRVVSRSVLSSTSGTLDTKTASTSKKGKSQ